MSSTELNAPQKILVCVDGSEIGFRAAEFAIALSKGLGSRLIFANVIGASASEREYNISADMVGSFEVLGQEALAKCEERARNNGVQSEKIQLAGDPADEILKSR